MDVNIIIAVLLSVIGFLLGSLYLDIKKISRNVERLMINDAATKERLEDLERRIDIVEHLKTSYNGKR